jgi:outer membrane lipoprotein-sorting protein/predicted small lipoprotein YifL
MIGMRQRPLLVFLATMMLAGCGQRGPVSAPLDDMRSLPVRQSQGPVMAPMDMMPGTNSAAPVLARIAQTWGTVKTLSAHFDSWQVKDNEREDGSFNVYYRKPYRYRYEVEKASSPIKNGSTAVFDTRTGDITARLGSVASIFPLKSKLDDARGKSVRGHRLDQGDYENLIKLLLAPSSTVRLVSPPGASPVVVAIVRPPQAITDELRLTLDARTGLIGQIEHVYQGKIVSRSTITKIKINPAIEAGKLEL